ncbi:MAG: carboxypeptidase regulatory-like domain-containing protein [Candidatus Sericytochromatia bacterium]|nr:carboxypeptidase regulatory-like domain-containing protein [Candidatus Sericytochromatia bacterium]
MKSFKRFSFSGLACLLMATTLPVACQAPDGSNPLSALLGAPTGTPAEGTASVTGILYTGRAADGRLVPPRTPIAVQILDRGTEIKSVDSDAMGRFYIDGIEVPKEGKRLTIRIANIFDQNQMLFPGRVLDLSAIQAQLASTSQQSRRIVGTLLDTNGNPLSNARVQDKEFNFRSTTTNAQGEFTLEVSSPELEVTPDGQLFPFSVGVEAFDDNPLVTIDTNNIRIVEGVLGDQTNSNVFLEGVRIRVQGSNISTRTGEGGRFVLNGAPIAPFVLEVEPPTGYAPITLQIPPATFDSNQAPEKVAQDIQLQPVGSIVVNFAAESSPFVSCGLDDAQEYIHPLAPNSCKRVLASFEPVATYHNYLSILNPQRAFVEVEGTDIVEEIEYPVTPFYPVTVIGRTGDIVKITDEFLDFNVNMSLKLKNVPGGQQNITISMTNFQTQKSIPIYVPPGDTISTERIILRRPQVVSGLGDVKGIIKGINPDLPGELRITFIDMGDDVNYDPRRNELLNPTLLNRIQANLSSGNIDVVNKQTGEYYLRNVPTGTRIMLVAAMVNADGTLSDCYIPNTSVLLNVRSGQINLAPDMNISARPIGTGNCSGS